MIAKKDFKVNLVSPSVWRSLISDSFNKLKQQEQDLAHSILTTMHNRHIGVTPELVANLTPCLLDPNAQLDATGVWAAIFERLIDELSIGEEAKNKSYLMRFGLLLSSSPIYSVIRLAMPIVEEACRQIGRCYLFCADELKTSVQADSYSAYSNDLTQTIIQMARRQDDKFQLFWKERAITLSSFSRQPTILGHPNTTLPESDPIALAFLLRLEPDMSSLKSKSQHSERLRIPIKRQRIRQLKEGQIEGIHITRRIEDLDTIRLSELTNHRVVLADHLINTGYLAIKRPPKRDKLRDVLIAALMPAEVKASLSGDFLKACWFDFSMRLSLILRQSRLYQSEFRWIEEHTFGHTRTCTFLLQEMPIFETNFESSPSKAYRQEFMSALRWLPSYLDTREPLNSQTLLHDTEKQEDGNSPKEWAFSAWAAQKDNTLWINRQNNKSSQFPLKERKPITANRRLKSEDFAFVHIMLFLPADKRDELGMASGLGRLYNGFHLGKRPGQHVSITWVPYRIKDAESWAFDVRGRPNSALTRSTQTKANEPQIAGRLEHTWLEQLKKEMWSA